MLLLHGGQADSEQAVKWTNLSVLRMAPFARAARLAGPDALAVAMLRFSVRGWNGVEASPVGDARAALAAIGDEYPGMQVVLVGHSMGGRVALAVADDTRVTDVIGLAPWVVPGEVRWPSGLRGLLVHGLPDRTTSAKASRAIVESLQTQGKQASFVGLEGENHAMLRRAGTWGRLLRGYLGASLGAADGRVPQNEVEALGARAVSEMVVTVI